MINIEMEDQIRNVINLLMKIQGDKRYTEKTSNFQNIFLIIKGLLEEVRNITIPMLNDILINFSKKPNLEKYQLSHLILSEMKNILSAPTNQLVFHMINNDYTSAKDKKIPEILKLSNDDFVLFLKNLSKISHEYLINYLSSIPLNESLMKSKIRNVSHFEILLKIYSNKNSVFIAKDYSQLFYNFLDCFSQKSTKENDKFKIFTSLLKFIYNNNKLELKRNNLYQNVLEKIKSFFNEIKNEAIGMNVMNTICEKLIKNKKIPKKILQLSQIFIDHKNQNLVLHLIETNFALMKKKIFNTSSLFDLFSEEKRTNITKMSFLLNNLLNKYGLETLIKFKKEFEAKIMELILMTDNKPKTLIIFFYLTLNDSKANGIFHKFLLDCSDIFCVIVKHFFTPNEAEDNITLSPIRSVPDNIYKNSKIAQRIENSKIKLEQTESNLLKLIEQIKTNEYHREIFLNLLELDAKNISGNIDKLLGNYSEYSQEDFQNFKKAFAISLEEKDIYHLIEWGVLLINNNDSDNIRAHEYLQCILSVFYYYLKQNINYLIINNENNDDTRLTQFQMEDSYSIIFSDIIEFMRRILTAKIKSREVINYIIVIIKILNEIKAQSLSEQINNLILNNLSAFSLDNYEISIKSLAKLYYDLNRSHTKEAFVLPNNFDYYLYESDKKLSAVKFINELLKIDRKNTMLNNIVFKDNLKVFILDDLRHADNEMYTRLIDELVVNPDDSQIKKDLIHLLCMKHEIYKYEFYSLFISNDPDLVNMKSTHEKFVKNIFNRLYELSNYQNEIDDIIKKNKSLSNSEDSDDSSQGQDEENKNYKIKKILKQLNNIDIGKYINLIFKHFDNGIQFKPNHQIKLMNLAIYNDIFVRDHFLKKIEKCLKIKKTIYYNLHTIPITMIYLNDPDKALRKKANYLLAIFINHLLLKLNEYKEQEKYKNKNILYKYLPEAYLSYLLMYFIFNSNFNLILQAKETKNFHTVIISYLKILKKITNNKFDSNFLIQNCMKIKNLSLKNKKVIKKISSNTYIKNLIKADNYSITSDNYDHVKNEVCNMVIKLINMEYTTKFKYEEFKPQIPIIFLSEKELNLALSNMKSEKDKEDNSAYFNENIDVSKIDNTNYSDNYPTVKSTITKFTHTTQNKSHIAVKDHQLRLDMPLDITSKSKSIVENDFDEFENLPYYNKYKNKNDSPISNKEFEVGLNLESDHEDRPIPLSNKKMFDEEDNRIQEIVNEELNEEENKRKRKSKKENESEKEKIIKKKRSKK